MYAQPTTLISVLSGTTTDDLGDETDNTTVAASGIRASLLEQRTVATTPADNRAQVVRYFTGRVSKADLDRFGVHLNPGDRIQDERTAEIYVIDAVSRVASSTTTNDLRLDLRRVTD